MGYRDITRRTLFYLFFLFIIFSFCILSQADGQTYYPYQHIPTFGTLGLTGMPSYSLPNYQYNQNWNLTGTAMQPNFMTMNYFSGMSQSGGTRMAEGELIVHFSDTVQIGQGGGGPSSNMTQINDLIQQYGIYEITASGSGGFYVIKFSKDHAVSDVRGAFENLTGIVESAEPNLIRTAHTTMPGSYNTMSGIMSTQFSSPVYSSFIGPQWNSLNITPSFNQGFSQLQIPQMQSFNQGFSQLQIPQMSSFNQGLSQWQTQTPSYFQPSFTGLQQFSWGLPQSFSGFQYSAPSFPWIY